MTKIFSGNYCVITVLQFLGIISRFVSFHIKRGFSLLNLQIDFVYFFFLTRLFQLQDDYSIFTTESLYFCGNEQIHALERQTAYVC